MLLLVVLVVQFFDCDCQPHRTRPYTTAEHELRSSLFANYDHTLIPQPDKGKPLLIRLDIVPRFISVESDLEEELEVNCWLFLSWTDLSLRWSLKTYDLVYISVDSDHLWKPDIMLYTAFHMWNSFPNMDRSKCIVFMDGEIVCPNPTVFSARCSTNLTHWPFDVQNCSLKMGFGAFPATQIDFIVQSEENDGFDRSKFLLKNRKWEILDTSIWRHVNHFENDTYPFLTFNLLLKRHSGAQRAVVVVPALVLASLSLAYFGLELGSVERVATSGTNLLCHILYLTHLSSHLPSVGDNCPLIVLFFRDSLLLVALSLVTSMMLHVLAAGSRRPPSWIQGPLSNMQRDRTGQLLLQALGLEGAVTTADMDDGSEGATLVSFDNPQLRWRQIAALSDRVLCVAFFSAYVGLVVRLLQ